MRCLGSPRRETVQALHVSSVNLRLCCPRLPSPRSQGSIIARYPWALQNAKEAAPQLAWASKTFRAVVDQVAGAWAASQAITCGLCIVSDEA